MSDEAEILPPEEAPSPAGRFNPKTISWWHEAFADWLMQNPDKSVKDAAEVFKVTPSYLYMLKNSDTFKAYWLRRRQEVTDGVQDKTVSMFGTLQDKLNALAEVSLDVLNQKMEQVMLQGVASNVPVETILETADLALKKLGYGVPTAPAGGTTTNVNVTVSAADLAAARDKMAKIYGVTPASPAPVQIEGESTDVTDVT